MSHEHFDYLVEELSLLRHRVHEEGQCAYLCCQLVNPYQPETSDMAQCWHSGWMAGAGMHSHDQIRAYVIYKQTENAALRAERDALLTLLEDIRNAYPDVEEFQLWKDAKEMGYLK